MPTRKVTAEEIPQPEEEPEEEPEEATSEALGAEGFYLVNHRTVSE